MGDILTVATKEFRDDFRNRWTIAITVLFAVLALGIAYFGAATSGGIGFASLETTLASLTTLGAFVIPLIGLLIAYDSIVGEHDRGILILLLSYPLSRTQLITGKFVGHTGALVVAAVLGFGLAFAAIEVMSPVARAPAALSVIPLFILTSALLGASFAGMACMISVIVTDRSRAGGLSLLTWFVFVVVFDLVLLSVLVATRGNGLEQALFPYLLLLNPVDVFRLINLQMLGAGGGDIFMSMTAVHAYHPAVLYAALVAWATVPFAVALLIFRRQEA